MKKLFTILLAFSFAIGVFSQAPEKISYQAVIRNAGGQLLTSQSIGIRIQILQSSEFGAAVYVETHTRPTNANGLVTLEIGEGTVVTGSFSGINWTAGPYFLKTEIDPAGGTSYSIIGTTQLLSVPYALHAKESNHLKGSITESQISDLKYYLTSETDPVYSASPVKGITGSNITNWNTAFGWGNHTGLYRLISYVPAWSEITLKPTTLSGYGITDALSSSHPANAISGTNITNWNTAFGWGNHAGLYRLISWVPSWMDVTDKPSVFPPSVHSHSAADITSGTLDAASIPILDIGTKTSGTLSVARGGTAATTFTSGNVLIGNGTGAITTLSRSGIDTRATFPPETHAHSAADITTGTLAVARGGTGLATYTAGNYIRASGATTLEQRTPAQVRTDIGAGTVSSIATGNGITGGTITTTGTLGLTGQALALHNLGTNGIIARTGTGTVAARTISAGTGITVTNGNGVSGNPAIAVKTYAIGDFAHGGIVFWVDATGQHGLVCAKTDQSAGTRWYAGTNTHTMAYGDGPLSGEMNTVIIIANQGRGDGYTYAARTCNELQVTEGGTTYGDWYLPSKEELYMMYQNKTTINATAMVNGGTSIASTYYWSSTEDSSWYDCAFMQGFENGWQLNQNKYYPRRVRAVRAF